jgi:hypothetical protein
MPYGLTAGITIRRVSLHRQVTFKIPSEDEHLLDVASREHGGITNALIAGLRALERERAGSPPSPRQAPPHESPGDEPRYWRSPVEVAGYLAIGPETATRWARHSPNATRDRDDAIDVRALEIDGHRTAGLLELKPATLRRRHTDQKPPLRTERGHYRLGDLELTTEQAQKRAGLSEQQLRQLADDGTIRTRVDSDGTIRHPLIDVDLHRATAAAGTQTAA